MITIDASAIEQILTPHDLDNYVSSLTDATLPLLGKRTSVELIMSAMDRVDGVLTVAKSQRIIDDFTLQFNLEKSLATDRRVAFEIGITPQSGVQPENHSWCVERMMDVCDLVARNPDAIEPYARLLFEKIVELAGKL